MMFRASQDGQAQYSALMLPSGSCIDDCVVHRFGPDHYFLCVNAANTDRTMPGWCSAIPSAPMC